MHVVRNHWDIDALRVIAGRNGYRRRGGVVLARGGRDVGVRQRDGEVLPGGLINLQHRNRRTVILLDFGGRGSELHAHRGWGVEDGSVPDVAGDREGDGLSAGLGDGVRRGDHGEDLLDVRLVGIVGIRQLVPGDGDARGAAGEAGAGHARRDHPAVAAGQGVVRAENRGVRAAGGEGDRDHLTGAQGTV